MASANCQKSIFRRVNEAKSPIRVLLLTDTSSLPRGATFFWDPITCANLQPHRPLPPALHGGSYQPRRDQQSQVTYNEYIRQNPPAYGKNHYKGDMVWANFGYYLAEGKWVDPESEGELFAAYMNPPSSHMVEPNLPDLPRRRDHGPCILTPQEQDQFYQEFVEDVTDEHDSEGDPRAWRITPETFAQWAAGAAAGDQYEETLMKTPASLDKLTRYICWTSMHAVDTDLVQEKLPRRSSSKKQRIPPRPDPELQFDVETGSLLSGIYEPERSPSLLESPIGLSWPFWECLASDFQTQALMLFGPHLPSITAIQESCTILSDMLLGLLGWIVDSGATIYKVLLQLQRSSLR